MVVWDWCSCSLLPKSMIFKAKVPCYRVWGKGDIFVILDERFFKHVKRESNQNQFFDTRTSIKRETWTAEMRKQGCTFFLKNGFRPSAERAEDSYHYPFLGPQLLQNTPKQSLNISVL